MLISKLFYAFTYKFYFLTDDISAYFRLMTIRFFELVFILNFL